MKLTLLCIAVLIAVASAEDCTDASKCTLETCSSGVVACVNRVCTCDAVGAGCQNSHECHNDQSLHCPQGDKHCENNVCKCVGHHHGPPGGHHGHNGN